MKEIPKRLPPLSSTVRELYLKSGNNCAFPGCKRRLFNIKGVFIGQICHIEAAEPGGKRFNASQSNEQRRLASNLMLMCYDHHVETDDVVRFPVEALWKLKMVHESKFSDVVETMLDTVRDLTELVSASFPKNLNKMNRVLGWNNDSDELTEIMEELMFVIEKYSAIPLPARTLFDVLVKRGKRGYYGTELSNPVLEIRQATNLSFDELKAHIAILDRHGFIKDDGPDEYNMEAIAVMSLKSGWNLWLDIRRFCKIEKIELKTITHDMNFSVLGEE